MAKSFEEFMTESKYIKLQEIGDFVDVIVAVDVFTLKPKPSSFKDPNTGEPKLQMEYVFKDIATGAEKTWSNGSQAVAQTMAKTKVGDKVRVIAIEKGGKKAYAVRLLDAVKGQASEAAPTAGIPF